MKPQDDEDVPVEIPHVLERKARAMVASVLPLIGVLAMKKGVVPGEYVIPILLSILGGVFLGLFHPHDSFVKAVTIKEDSVELTDELGRVTTISEGSFCLQTYGAPPHTVQIWPIGGGRPRCFRLDLDGEPGLMEEMLLTVQPAPLRVPLLSGVAHVGLVALVVGGSVFGFVFGLPGILMLAIYMAVACGIVAGMNAWNGMEAGR